MMPDELEKLPKPLDRTMSNLEISVMAEVVDRIKNASEITPVIDHLLNRMYASGSSKKKLQDIVSKALNEADGKVDNIYKIATSVDHVRNKALYHSLGRDYLPLEDNGWLQQIIDAARRQTKDDIRPFENLTQTTGFNIIQGGKRIFTPLSEYFERSLDKSLLSIASGTQTYSQAINSIIDEMTSSGLRVIDYTSGKADRIEVAARRAVMTGVARLTDKINEKNAEELNTDHWEVDWHMGARNKGVGIINHQSWQGKVYNSEEMVSICGLGDILGFAGINCYHVRFPFIPGVSKRKYTDEWLENQNKKENTQKEYRGKQYDLYDALQYQRKIERTIRKQTQDVKLLERAGADEDTIIEARSRLQGTKTLYADFSKKMELRQQLERLKMHKGSKYADMGMSATKEPLNAEDRYFINKAMSFESYILNEKLRNSEALTEKERLLMRGIDNAILKLPEYKGTVYRSIGIDRSLDEDKFDKEHQPGAIVIYPAFTSASLEVYDDSMKYLLVVLSKHGKNMTEYNPGEQEVLFKRGSMFYITSRDGNIIYMEEA